jgi:predicted secreted Zn-dependent protease
LIGEHPSPDGKYKAVLFVRDCGATTVLSTQVSLLRLNAQLKNGSGNLFIADTDHGKIPSRQKGGPEVRIVWEGSKDIYIVHHENARVFKAEKKVNGINVNYKSLKNENDNKANEADVKKPVRPCRLEFHLARSLFADVIEDYIRIRNRQICKRFYSGYYVASPPIYLIAL